MSCKEQQILSVISLSLNVVTDYIDRKQQLMNNPDSSKYLEQQQTGCNDSKTFFALINQFSPERDQLDLKDINTKVDRVILRLKQLDEAEINEWKGIQLRKIMQLSESIKQERTKLEQAIKRGKIISAALKEQLRIFVFSSDICRIVYDKELIAKIITELYFDEYHEEVLSYFKKAGYSTTELSVLKFKQEKPMSCFRCCCFWWIGAQ